MHKSQKEAAELAKAHAARRKLAAERRAQQEANVKAKKAATEGDKAVTFAEAEEGDEDEDDIPEEDKIVDDGWRYEDEHGLPVPGSDEELAEEDSDLEEYDDEAGEMAMGSDADDSDESEQDAMLGELDEDDDSDLEPIPISQAYGDESEDEDEDDADEDGAPLAKKSKPSANKPRRSAMGFSHKGFVKQERKAPPKPRGIAPERGPTKKEIKRQTEEAKKRGAPKGRPRYEDEHGDDDKGRSSGGTGRGGRGGRGGAPSRGGRGGGDSGRGRGRGGKRRR